MNARAASVMAARPTAEAPLLIVREPYGEQQAATQAGSWLHQAAVYRAAKPPNSQVESHRLRAMYGTSIKAP